MIEPQPHNSQRGVIGQQHGLQRLTDTLEALSRGQSAQQQRDTQIQAHLATVTQQVTALALGAKRLTWVVGALTVLTLGLGGLVGWQYTHRPELGYAHALGTLDQAVVQQWSMMPKATQEAFSALYTRLGLQPPSQRK